MNSTDKKLGWTPLYRTVTCGHLETTALLLRNGADPNVTTRLGESPLHQAIDDNNQRLVELLLKHSAAPNTQQNDGETPLHYAVRQGLLEIVKCLLAHSADPNVQNYFFGRTPLHLAVETDNLSIVQALLLYAASTDIQDSGDATPVQLAKNSTMKQTLYSEGSEDSEGDIEEGEFRGRVAPRAFTVKQRMWETSKLETNLSGPRSSFGVSTSLYTWLSNHRLEFLYEALTLSGIEDINTLLGSAQRVDEGQLQDAGISLPGHRRRLLAYLETELKRTKPQEEALVSLSCCSAQKTIREFTIKPNLHEWLEKISLAQLITNFQESGYDDLEHLLFMMKTQYALNDFLLKSDLGIQKLGHRHRILAKLRQDAFLYHKQDLSTLAGGLALRKEGDLVGCAQCVLT